MSFWTDPALSKIFMHLHFVVPIAGVAEAWPQILHAAPNLHRGSLAITGRGKWGIPNTLRPRKNGSHIPDDIFMCIFLIAIRISLKFVPKVQGFLFTQFSGHSLDKYSKSPEHFQTSGQFLYILIWILCTFGTLEFKMSCQKIWLAKTLKVPIEDD